MIVLRPHVGTVRGRQVDLGLDGIFEVSALWPQGRRLGFVDRRRGAPLQFVEPVADCLIAEAKRVVDARDFDDLPEEIRAQGLGVRDVQLAPPPLPDEDEDDDE